MGTLNSKAKAAARASHAREQELVAQIEANPRDSWAALDLALLHVRRDRPTDVLAWIATPAIQLSDDADIHRHAAWLLVEIGAFEEALAQAEKGLALNPHGGLKTLHERARRRMAAEAALGVTPALKRTYLKAIERLVRKRAEKAADLFSRVVAAAPGFAPAWIGLRGALEAQGEVEAAAALEARWVAAHPASAGAARIAMGRRLSPDGLIFDRRGALPFLPLHEVMEPVRSLPALEAASTGCLALDPGGEDVVLDPVIGWRPGGGDRVVLRHRTPEVFVAGIENAALVGRGVVLDANGVAVRELHSASVDKYGAIDQGEKIAFDSVLFRSWLGEVKIHDTPALLMTGATDKSFGDWMLNFMPRLAIARAAGLRCPVVVADNAPAPFIELLRQMGVRDEDIIRHDPRGVTLFRKLYVTSWPLHEFLRPMSGLFDVFRDLARPATDGPGRRLYLSRERIARRDMVNEAELRGTFERYGFEVVHPQDLSLAEMRDLLADADYVAGPYGSAFLNLAMAGRKPTAIVCMPPMLKSGYLRQVALWLGAMGLKFAYVTGQQVGEMGRLGIKDAAWAAPIPEVETLLRTVLKPAALSSVTPPE